MAIGANNSLSVSHLDPAFKADDSLECHLSVEFGFNGIKALVLDLRTNKYVAFEKEAYPELFTFKALNQRLVSTLGGSGILNKQYKSVGIAFTIPQHTLVPKGLFEPGKERDYLSFSFEETENLEMVFDELLVAAAVNIYGVDSATKNIITKQYPNARLFHHSSVLIETELKNRYQMAGASVSINIRNKEFDQLVIVNGKLEFINSFEYQTPEDILYYVLHTCEQLKLNTGQTEFAVFADDEQYNTCNDLLQQYLPKKKAVTRSNDYSYADFFSQIKPYELYTLVNQFACA